MTTNVQNIQCICRNLQYRSVSYQMKGNHIYCEIKTLSEYIHLFSVYMILKPLSDIWLKNRYTLMSRTYRQSRVVVKVLNITFRKEKVGGFLESTNIQ